MSVEIIPWDYELKLFNQLSLKFLVNLLAQIDFVRVREVKLEVVNFLNDPLSDQGVDVVYNPLEELLVGNVVALHIVIAAVIVLRLDVLPGEVCQQDDNLRKFFGILSVEVSIDQSL